LAKLRLDWSKDRLRFVDALERQASKAAKLVLREAALEGFRQEQALTKPAAEVGNA
jgi:hypothetical protein